MPDVSGLQAAVIIILILISSTLLVTSCILWKTCYWWSWVSGPIPMKGAGEPLKDGGLWLSVSSKEKSTTKLNHVAVKRLKVWTLVRVVSS